MPRAWSSQAQSSGRHVVPSSSPRIARAFEIPEIFNKPKSDLKAGSDPDSKAWKRHFHHNGRGTRVNMSKQVPSPCAGTFPATKHTTAQTSSRTRIVFQPVSFFVSLPQLTYVPLSKRHVRVNVSNHALSPREGDYSTTSRTTARTSPRRMIGVLLSIFMDLSDLQYVSSTKGNSPWE